MSRPTPRPRISVLIVTYDSGGWAPACVASLFASAPRCPFEVIVVDNASRDGGPDALQTRWGSEPGFRLIRLRKNTGFAAANCRGYAVARGEYVLVLNPDTRVHPGTLDSLLAEIESSSDIGALGPRLFDEEGRIEDSYRRFPSVSDILAKRTPLGALPGFRRRVDRYLMRDRDPRAVQDVDWVHGACILLPRRAIEDAGGLFDERFFLFFEEIDLCRRLWKRRWRVVYCPRVGVFHQGRRLSGGGVKRLLTRRPMLWLVQSAAKYYAKYFFRRLPVPRGGAS